MLSSSHPPVPQYPPSSDQNHPRPTRGFGPIGGFVPIPQTVPLHHRALSRAYIPRPRRTRDPHPHIINLFDEPFDVLGPGVALLTSRLSRHSLGIANFPNKQLSPVPGVSFLSTDVDYFSLCFWFVALGIVDGGVDLGPKFGPCLLQFVGQVSSLIPSTSSITTPMY